MAEPALDACLDGTHHRIRWRRLAGCPAPCVNSYAHFGRCVGRLRIFCAVPIPLPLGSLDRSKCSRLPGMSASISAMISLSAPQRGRLQNTPTGSSEGSIFHKGPFLQYLAGRVLRSCVRKCTLRREIANVLRGFRRYSVPNKSEHF
jgi:hypothetical protein